MADQEQGGLRRWSRGAVADRGDRGGGRHRGGRGTARQHHGAEGRSAECLLPRRRTDRRHHRSGDLGQELSAAVRRLPAHGRSAAHALRRQRGHAAIADRSRPAIRRGAVPARRRSPPEDDVGGLCVCGGFPEEARPRLHARGPDVHRARAGLQAAGHLHSLSCLGVRALQEGGQRRSDQGLRALQPDAVRGGAQGLLASDRLHRLPRRPTRWPCA